jgi:hypothetical protein
MEQPVAAGGLADCDISMNRVVIVHHTQGIYVGSCMGLGFWSNLDTANQWTVVTLPSEQAARDYVASWHEWNNPDSYTYPRIDCSGTWATIDELNRAGLGHLTGPLLINAPVAGSA